MPKALVDRVVTLHLGEMLPIFPPGKSDSISSTFWHLPSPFTLLFSTVGYRDVYSMTTRGQHHIGHKIKPISYWIPTMQGTVMELKVMMLIDLTNWVWNEKEISQSGKLSSSFHITLINDLSSLQWTLSWYKHTCLGVKAVRYSVLIGAWWKWYTHTLLGALSPEKNIEQYNFLAIKIFTLLTT